MSNHKATKFLDLFLRSLYILLFIPIGGWALFFADHYAEFIEASLNTPLAKGEIQVLGAVYLLSGLWVAYTWFNKNSNELYRAALFMVSALLLSRLVALIKGDLDQTLMMFAAIEIPFFIATSIAFLLFSRTKFLNF